MGAAATRKRAGADKHERGWASANEGRRATAAATGGTNEGRCCMDEAGWYTNEGRWYTNEGGWYMNVGGGSNYGSTTTTVAAPAANINKGRNEGR